MSSHDHSPAASRSGGRIRRLLAVATAAGALAAGMSVAPAVASAAPARAAAPAAASAASTASAIPIPSWAHAPAQTMILRSRVKLLAAYPYYRGKAPSDRYGVVVRLKNPTPQGFPLVMAGYGITGDYVLAELPVKTNNYFAWVKVRDVAISSTPYRVEIKQTKHTLLLWKDSQIVGAWPVAVGKPSTPTPVGYFFINAVLPAPNAAYGTVVMSTSGFSQVYTTFGDGDAAIGIHGTDEESSIGQSVSHGCVRMHTRDAKVLAHYMALGTAVVIEK